MTEWRAGDGALGGDGADSRRLDEVVLGAGAESLSQRGIAASVDELSDHVTDPRLGDALAAREHDLNGAQVDADQVQVCASAHSAQAPALASDSASRPPSVRTNRRFTVTKLTDVHCPSSPLPALRLPTVTVSSASPTTSPIASCTATAAAATTDSAGDALETHGWDYGPTAETTATTATTATTVAAAAGTASTAGVAAPGLPVSAAPACRCSQSALPQPPGAASGGLARLSPLPAPVVARLPTGVLAGPIPGAPAGYYATLQPGARPIPGAPAGYYATLQPGVGGVPPSAYYHQAPRQPLLATGHSATLAAGLAGSARLQQALQSRLAAGGDSIHPRLQPSHPLYRQLAAADYNPSHTISYGHSDGRQLKVRRLIDWELPDLHTVRKYTSDVDSESDADSVLSVVPTHRSSRGRTTWTNKVEFILACLGYAVGLGNLWRFPYLCYKSGGGAFFIPYLIMMVVCSIPLLLMELTIGQFTRQGPVGAMGRLCPLLKGAGLAPVVISFIFCTYYNVVIAWALYYLFSSFSSELPWASCNNSAWNTPNCDNSISKRALAAAVNITSALGGEDPVLGNETSVFGNGSSVLGSVTMVEAARGTATLATTPAEEFFSRRVLELSSGVSDLGTVRIPLMLTLLLAWVLVYFSIWKSIRSSGKVVYVTVIAPYLLLTAFLWRALTLEGASTGIRFLFKPHWQLLGDSKVWVNALAQNFNSVGIGFGSMITFASYNKFENRTILLDTMVIILANLLTSVFAGIIVFATLGNIAMELDRDIQKVVVDGPGLVYVVYPKALASMPFPQLWSVLFFFMLLCLGLDSQFATLEVVITSLQDGYDSLVRRYLKRHELLVLVICLVSFGLGLPYVTQGGMYVFQLMDYNVTNTSLILLALFEVGAVAWVYGTKRLSQDFLAMTGKRLSNYFIVCLKFLAPLLILAIWVFSLIDHEPLTYGPYDYPVWAFRLGWLLVALPVLPIPICAGLTLWRAPGETLMERLKASVQPDRRVRRDEGFEPTVDGPDHHGLQPNLCYEMSPLAAQIPYSAVNGDADSK